MSHDVSTNEIMDSVNNLQAELRGSVTELQGSITDIMEFLKENMMTREESMQTFATKDDLEQFEQRAMSTFATKDDLKKELSALEDRALKIFATKEDLEDCATKKDLLEFKSEILTAIDHIAKDHKDFQQELLMLRHTYDRVEERLVAVEVQLAAA